MKSVLLRQRRSRNVGYREIVVCRLVTADPILCGGAWSGEAGNGR